MAKKRGNANGILVVGFAVVLGGSYGGKEACDVLDLACWVTKDG